MNIDIIITKYLSKSATDEEIEELLSWVEASEDNKKVFTDIQNTWNLASMISPDTDEQRNQNKLYALINKLDHQEKVKSKIHQLHRKQIWIEIRRYAAIIVITIGISGLITYSLWHKSIAPAGLHQLRVPCGQQAELTLDDGTKIWLNAKSTLTYPGTFNGKNRTVTLDGEAYFEVTHVADKLFVVKTSYLDVKVLGTSFNVTSYSNDRDLKLTLVKGVVSLSKPNDNKEMTRLKPGELAICQKSTLDISIDTVDTDLYTSWRHGQFKFKELSFEEISKRLSRNYNIQFVFLNKNLKNIRYNGSFYNYESLDQILQILKTNSHFLYKIKKDTVIIK